MCCHAPPEIWKRNNGVTFFFTADSLSRCDSPITKEIFIMKHIVFVPVIALLGALSALAQQTTFNEETVAQLQKAMATGKLTSVTLTQFYINRIQSIDQKGGVNSVIE